MRTYRAGSRVVPASAVTALALAMSGCAGPDPAAPSSSGRNAVLDCASQVRADGVVFTSYGHTERAGDRHGTAEEADCHDVGRDAAGSVFPDPPRRVATWTFAGHAPAHVLGVRHDGGGPGFVVFVADTVPRDDAAAIFTELGRTERGS